VTGRRPDGYHLLDSIAVFADCGDRVSIAPADSISLSVRGPFAAHAPADATDLAWRAAEQFFAEVGRSAGAAISVDKNIPAGAGFGGGSSDAAAVLTVLNRRHGSALSDEALAAIGLTLGADVPMCLAGRALRAQGIGERIEPISGWPPLPLVLVWPGQKVSTRVVFERLLSRENPPLRAPPPLATPGEVAAWLRECRNDLEPPALAAAPEIAAALDALRGTRGCLLARMSGSGSGCFGLYAEMADAGAAEAELSAAHPKWWMRATVAR
jgi:4-diphosphocytidyl-2-C-methyl-D-erythritol kinase